MLSPFVQVLRTTKDKCTLMRPVLVRVNTTALLKVWNTYGCRCQLWFLTEEEKHKEKINVAYQNRRAQLYFWLRHACEDAVVLDKPDYFI